ncbi:MAG: blue (type 1) copper domain protein [Gemmatimonadetes bacterium]|nr:blue (type 1) copper domain protein [Gemmatimonadota bacterium]
MRSRLMVAAIALGMSACGGGSDVGAGITSTGTPAGTTVVATNAVALLGSAFTPANIQVSPGTVVTWSNGDAITHNVTFTTGTTIATGDFSSGSKQLTMPTAAGTYAYRCTIHAGMTGSVLVK